jgi:hypothetical protein
MFRICEGSPLAGAPFFIMSRSAHGPPEPILLPFTPSPPDSPFVCTEVAPDAQGTAMSPFSFPISPLPPGWAMPSTSPAIPRLAARIVDALLPLPASSSKHPRLIARDARRIRYSGPREALSRAIHALQTDLNQFPVAEASGGGGGGGGGQQGHCTAYAAAGEGRPAGDSLPWGRAGD